MIDNFKAKKHHGAACWVAGWGATIYGGAESQNLRSVGLNLMEIDYCRSHTFYDSHILQSDELCAGLPPTEESSVNGYGEPVISSEKDSCQGLGFKDSCHSLSSTTWQIDATIIRRYLCYIPPKVIRVVHLFATSMALQHLLVLFHGVTNVRMKDIQEYTVMFIVSKNGSTL